MRRSSQIALVAGAIPALLENRERGATKDELARELEVQRHVVSIACRALRHNGYITIEDELVLLTPKARELLAETAVTA